MNENQINNRKKVSLTKIPSSRPELLAPAGDFSSLRAAIGNGADAVYFGAGMLNARRNAANFDSIQLAEAVEYAHLHSARAYLTLNTLIADEEGDMALELAAAAYTHGIDAVIIQDIGLASVLHQLLPDLTLFASTQMSISNEAGLSAAARLGLKRVILPRELSIPEITRLTAFARALGMETEVFIHGALCVCFSGQCLLSSLIGGCSGNRGECKQPCRLPYQLVGGEKSSGPWPLLSPRDQALIDYLPQLAQAGVTSFKIEGRMRSSSYVGQVTAIYRAALDRDLSSQPAENITESANRQLLLAFNRGGAFTSRYPGGKRKTDFLAGSFSGSFGLLLGRIISLEPKAGILKLMLDAAWPLAELPERGDVLSIRRPGADQETASCPIGTIAAQGRILQIKGFHPEVLEKLHEGDPVYRMTDRRNEKIAEQADHRKTAVLLHIAGGQTESGPITLTAAVGAGNGRPEELQVSCSRPPEPVTALNPDRLAQQLKKSGSTPFLIENVRQSGDIHLSISSINEMRREILDALVCKISRWHQRQLPWQFNGSWQDAVLQAKAQLAAQVQTDEKRLPAPVSAYLYQLPESGHSIACGADRYYVPILALTAQNAPAIRQNLREMEPQSRLLAWLPPAAAGQTASLLPQLIESLPEWGFDGLCIGQNGLDLISQGDAAKSAPNLLERITDTGANIYNQASQLNFIQQGADAICPSLELSAERLRSLCCLADATKIPLELPVYGRLRLMLSEFCPVGQNLPGCKLCHTRTDSLEQPDKAIPFGLKDRKDQIFPLLLHPRTCLSELLSQFLLCAPQDFCDLQDTLTDPANLQARLYFYDETSAERRALTKTCREMLVASEPGQRQTVADKFRQISLQIAGRLGAPLSYGHFRRGV